MVGYANRAAAVAALGVGRLASVARLVLGTLIGPAERLIQNAFLEPVHSRRVDRSDVPRIAADVSNRLELGCVAATVLTVEEMQPHLETCGPPRVL